MLYVKVAFVVLHLLAAAAYFGLGLRLAAWARALATAPGDGALAAQGTTTVREMGAALLATLVFALGAMFTPPGGFAYYPPTFHASLGLLLVLVAVHFAFVAPAWRKHAAAPSGEAVGRIAAGTGIGHLIWVVILVLMVAYGRVGI